MRARTPTSTAAKAIDAMTPEEASRLLLGSAEGIRYGRDKDTRVISKRVVRRPLPKAQQDFLRELGHSNPPTEIVHTHFEKGRPESLRRPNPGAGLLRDLDDLVIRVMLKAAFPTAASNTMATLAVRREGLAQHFNVPEHFISQTLERLNKAGIVGQESNTSAHDTNRSAWGGTQSGWSGSVRYVNREALMRLRDRHQQGRAEEAKKLLSDLPQAGAIPRATRP